MKKTNVLLLVLIGMLTLISCSSDDDNNDQNTESQNSFTYNNESYKLNFASVQSFDNHIQLTLADADYTSENFTGDIDFVGVLFDSETLPEGNYSFKLDTAQDYDSTVNFFDAEAGVNLSIVNGDADTTSNYFENINSGTISIEKSGEIYTINFQLIFNNGTFTGTYKGEVN